MADIRDELITRQLTQDNLEQMEGSPAKDGETDVGSTQMETLLEGKHRLMQRQHQVRLWQNLATSRIRQDKQRHRYQAKPLTHQNAMVVNMTHDHAHVR